MPQSTTNQRVKYAAGEQCSLEDFIDTNGPSFDEDGSYLVSSETALAAGATHVWTQVDCDGETYLLPGFHFVNRTGSYVVTQHPWITGYKEIAESDPDDEDDLDEDDGL